MEPTVMKIFEDLNRVEELMSEIHVKGKQDQNAKENKQELSDILAYAVYEIRRKYELTSMLWCVSEGKAMERYKEEYGDETDGK